MDKLDPRDHAEEVALFRSQVIGVLICRMLTRGELRRELCRLSTTPVRPPRSQVTRTYSVPTLERWYYAYRSGGLDALKPRPRGDRGRARALTEELRELLLDIRREYPTVSAELILRTLSNDGRLKVGQVSPSTLRRLYAQHGLDRLSKRSQKSKHTRIRLRWQMDQPNMLWHGDVCHGPNLVIDDGKTHPVRVHALLDDASRYIVAIAAFHTEKEVDMLQLLLPALRRHGLPDGLYLDNGSTYRGDTLATFCGRLNIGLVHAAPYDPQARGTMERFWRTLREQLLDFVGHCTSLHDINVRIWAWVDRYYHRAPHAGLIGRSPEAVFAERQRPDKPADEDALREALIVRLRRRVRRDCTLSLDGRIYETNLGILAGKSVTVARYALDPPASECAPAPWLERDGERSELRLVDPVANSRRSRAELPAQVPNRGVDFDPPTALLDRTLGRQRRNQKENL